MFSYEQTRNDSSARSTAEPEDDSLRSRSSGLATGVSRERIASRGEAGGGEPLIIALIGPNEQRRSAAAIILTHDGHNEIREFPSYPPAQEDDLRQIENEYDAVLVDLDSNPARALDLVESIGANARATVMVYSSSTDPDLLVRCMQAGAREFLTYPFAPDVVAEALARAEARRPAAPADAKAAGRLLAVMGSKGGVGATMVACNLAVALAQQKNQKTLLIDLDLPLGGAALNLGLKGEFSTVEALDAAARMDARFLGQLLARHSTGLALLAAPGRYTQYKLEDASIEKLIRVARQGFDNVVLDLGANLEWTGTAIYREAAMVYLVTQASIPDLRNANRLIGQFFSGPLPKMEIVLNRYESRSLGVPDQEINKALTRPAQWKIPNDYPAVQRMQISATPLVMEDSAIARQIRKMAQAVTGQDLEVPEKKKKGFRLFA